MFNYSEAAKRYRELNPTADSISFIKYTTGMNQDKFDDILIGMAINKGNRRFPCSLLNHTCARIYEE